MKAPDFWSNPPDDPGIVARLLWPMTLAWRLGAWWRARGVAPYRARVPVICVGNLTAGGAGKTPMVGELVRLLAGRDRAVHVVMRGHGGARIGPHRVDPETDTHHEVGDEALIHAALAPTWIARDRAAGMRAAEAGGADVLVLDDGLQNPGLAPDLGIVMVDAGQGFGNGRLIPAGPLREPVAPGLARAGLVVLVGDDRARAKALAAWPVLAEAKPVPAVLAPVATGLPLDGAPVVAFAGIGRPKKFFDTLRGLGAKLRLAEPFPDHHDYAPAVLERLVKRARAESALLVTTEKDAVRLAPRHRREVLVLPVGLRLEAPERVDAALDALLFGR